MTIAEANARARKAYESQYTDRAKVTRYGSYRDPDTKRTIKAEEVIFDSLQCRISYKTVTSASPTETVTAVGQEIKLFVSPEIVIPSGCKIAVTRQGTTVEYKASGKPALYATHQEIVLSLFDGWA